MWKDIILFIIIIVIILLTDYFIQNYIGNSIEEMTGKLNYMREQVIKDNKDEKKISETEEEIREIWKKRYKKLASIIEHDELEKVENNLTAIYSALDSNEKSEVVSEINENIFVLRHIKDKYSFKVENIF